MKRRHFIQSTSAYIAGAALLPKTLSATKSIAPGDKINIAAIGINGMGWSDLQSMIKNPQAQCIALCDVDKNVLDKRVAELTKRDIKVTTYSDYRKVLDNKEIDAVIIGTPDHWHCKIMVDACEAGKHVYCEKPVGNSIAECEVMVASQKKYNRVVQVGQWQHSNKHYQDSMDFAHSGKLGNVRLVKAWAYQGWMKNIENKPDGPAPEGVHYDMWLGPATKRPFNPNRFHFNFRWYWDYAGGLMTDWGVHMIDYALLGSQATVPKSIMASGGKFAYPDDAEQTPDTLTTVYDFGTFNMLWEHATGINDGPYTRDHGVAFIGNNGTLIVDRGGWEDALTDNEGCSIHFDVGVRACSECKMIQPNCAPGDVDRGPRIELDMRVANPRFGRARPAIHRDSAPRSAVPRRPAEKKTVRLVPFRQELPINGQQRSA